MDKYTEVWIGGKLVDLSQVKNLPISISYRLEDRVDFTKKLGSASLSVKIPASLKNDKIANTFHNPGIEDLTEGKLFRGIQPAKIVIAGQELLVGKAFLQQAMHTDRPLGYEYDFYGNNSDWMIDLAESTLYDFLKHITFIFSVENIVNSWSFDGNSEGLPYVFAPVKYGNPMATANSFVTGLEVEDYNMFPEYMKPSLSKYWILYWGFKSLGYRIQSDFLDSEYFRRQVMPWTWGSFLDSDGTKLDVLKFLAKSVRIIDLLNTSYTGFLDVEATNDSYNGGYDNNNTYLYIAGSKEMRWIYPTTPPELNFGLLTATFHLTTYIKAVATANSDVEVRVQWFKNGVKLNNGNDNGNGTLLCLLNAPLIGRREFEGIVEDFCSINVSAGDYVSAKIYVHTFKSGVGIARLHLSIDEFKIDYFKTPLGGTINFGNFLAFKNYKFLDLVRGITDEFDLVLQTDSATKTVYIEPCHPYSTVNSQAVKSGGYFNGNFLDWTNKQDLKQVSTIKPFTDTERELIFKYKDDAADGTLKKLQDRNNMIVGLAKYVFPDRFAAGKKEIENRFFAPTMHYDVKQWINGPYQAPQMVIMVPENISNLSAGEAQNTFTPKSCYYKGNTLDYKWVFNNSDGYPYPLMFAVNYKPGGENDPVLSYCDEQISGEVGIGLLRRFYLQRLVIMRDGQYYSTWFNLNNNDVSNFLHREFIIIGEQKYELIHLDYEPLKNEPTQCTLRKWVPITE